MCLKVSVYICYVSVGNLAPGPPPTFQPPSLPRPFFIQLLQYTLQRETRVVEFGGGAWIGAAAVAAAVAGKIAAARQRQEGFML